MTGQKCHIQCILFGWICLWTLFCSAILSFPVPIPYFPDYRSMIIYNIAGHNFVILLKLSGHFSHFFSEIGAMLSLNIST